MRERERESEREREGGGGGKGGREDMSMTAGVDVCVDL